MPATYIPGRRDGFGRRLPDRFLEVVKVWKDGLWQARCVGQGTIWSASQLRASSGCLRDGGPASIPRAGSDLCIYVPVPWWTVLSWVWVEM